MRSREKQPVTFADSVRSSRWFATGQLRPKQVHACFPVSETHLSGTVARLIRFNVKTNSVEKMPKTSTTTVTQNENGQYQVTVPKQLADAMPDLAGSKVEWEINSSDSLIMRVADD